MNISHNMLQKASYKKKLIFKCISWFLTGRKFLPLCNLFRLSFLGKMSVAFLIQVICVEAHSDFLLCRVIWALAHLSANEQSHSIVKVWQRTEAAQLKRGKKKKGKDYCLSLAPLVASLKIVCRFGIVDSDKSSFPGSAWASFGFNVV